MIIFTLNGHGNFMNLSGDGGAYKCMRPFKMVSIVQRAVAGFRLEGPAHDAEKARVEVDRLGRSHLAVDQLEVPQHVQHLRRARIRSPTQSTDRCTAGPHILTCDWCSPRFRREARRGGG